MREEHLLNKTLLHATSMALVLMVLLGNGLAQWFSFWKRRKMSMAQVGVGESPSRIAASSL
jgi:hypothetical protein